MAPRGQLATQDWQLVQRSAQYSSSDRRCWLSGLWHQKQRSGQPLKKTVVRRPGPSCTENLRISKTTPVAELSKRNYLKGPVGKLRQAGDRVEPTIQDSARGVELRKSPARGSVYSFQAAQQQAGELVTLFPADLAGRDQLSANGPAVAIPEPPVLLLDDLRRVARKPAVQVRP